MRDPYEPVEGVTVVPTAPGNLMQSYVLGGREPVLVDTGLRWSGRRLARAVQGIGVKSIALTHAHADHAGSAGWLADLLSVPIRVSPADGERMATGEIDTHRRAAVRAVMRLLAPPPRARTSRWSRATTWPASPSSMHLATRPAASRSTASATAS